MAVVGTIPQNFLTTGAYSHNWTRRMNLNLLAMAVIFNPSVKGRVNVLPSTASEGDCYLEIPTKSICIWLEPLDDGAGDAVPAGFWRWNPTVGMNCLVEDEMKLLIFNWEGQWELLKDFNEVMQPIARPIQFFIPGEVEPNTQIYRYVAGMELTIPAGAAGSGATLVTAPSSAVVFTMTKDGTQFGTISFGAGSVDGVVSVPAETVIQPSHVENMYVKANMMVINSPADTFGASDLNITIIGKIRSID